MDWKEQLASLQGSLPESPAEDISTAETPKTKKNQVRTLNVVFERKGRGGKSATIIEGFGDMEADEVSALAGRLKSRLGIGGSARGGEILLQGDQRTPRLKELLHAEGFKTKGLS